MIGKLTIEERLWLACGPAENGPLGEIGKIPFDAQVVRKSWRHVRLTRDSESCIRRHPRHDWSRSYRGDLYGWKPLTKRPR